MNQPTATTRAAVQFAAPTVLDFLSSWPVQFACAAYFSMLALYWSTLVSDSGALVPDVARQGITLLSLSYAALLTIRGVTELRSLDLETAS